MLSLVPEAFFVYAATLCSAFFFLSPGVQMMQVHKSSGASLSAVNPQTLILMFFNCALWTIWDSLVFRASDSSSTSGRVIADAAGSSGERAGPCGEQLLLAFLLELCVARPFYSNMESPHRLRDSGRRHARRPRDSGRVVVHPGSGEHRPAGHVHQHLHVRCTFVHARPGAPGTELGTSASGSVLHAILELLSLECGGREREGPADSRVQCIGARFGCRPIGLDSGVPSRLMLASFQLGLMAVLPAGMSDELEAKPIVAMENHAK
mmetsp:Transcript_66841/g.216044  ORF Transcript_66841/g.216044 Transcript_66841/m.216044 type:complete len:265 (+) Transcript_66841:139-933(+)